jgi:hypothetical protein
MTAPKYVNSYPRQLIEFVMSFEQNQGALTTVAFADSKLARTVRSELWGLRNAIRREKREAEFPYFMSSRIYLRKHEIAIVSADQLPYAVALGELNTSKQ